MNQIYYPDPRECPECGKTFTPRGWDSAHGRGKYCSQECVDKAKSNPPIVKTCEFCGENMHLKGNRKTQRFHRKCYDEYQKIQRQWITCSFPGCTNKFQLMPWEIKKKTRTNCDEHRFYNSAKFKNGKDHRMWVEKVKCICEQCGIEFEMLPREVARGRGRFHNKDCRITWLSINHRGENHANYNPDRQPRYIGFTPSAKKRCRDFWENSCFITGVPESENINALGRQEDLTCHHIDGDKESLLIIPILRSEHNKIEGLVKRKEATDLAEILVSDLLVRLDTRGFTLDRYLSFLSTGKQL
jgi:hypothetical protein